MYQQQGLQEAFYLILYGAVTMLAVLACLYLLLRRRNMLGDTEPPIELTPDPSLGKGTVGGATLPDIGSRLKLKCEDTELYLRNDMKISELATILGTNRTYLGTWFAQQGLTYSTYINRLRIEYFCRHYDEVVSNITLQAWAVRCGYGSYSSFNANFKKIKGMTVTAWAEERAQEQAAKEHSEEQSQA